MAWWIWALALAVAASRTTNPLLLLLILTVLGLVVAMRRSDAPWARGYRFYLAMALSVIVIRIVFRIVFASGTTPGDQILFRLPAVAMPSWYAGVQIGGPVSLEAVLSAALDGARLACLLCCIGAANTLANPKRALRVLPGGLYELGVAVTVALSVAPQLVDSAQRVRRGRRLRGSDRRGLRALRAIAVPVLHDALERSLLLAAAMDWRSSAGLAARPARAGSPLPAAGRPSVRAVPRGVRSAGQLDACRAGDRRVRRRIGGLHRGACFPWRTAGVAHHYPPGSRAGRSALSPPAASSARSDSA